jgi:predicted AlkP superfamily pyrophosphatase or phosphodiesterase
MLRKGLRFHPHPPTNKILQRNGSLSVSKKKSAGSRGSGKTGRSGNSNSSRTHSKKSRSSPVARQKRPGSTSPGVAPYVPGKTTGDSTRRHLSVINVVGLTPTLLGNHTPNLRSLAGQRFIVPLEGVFPAVTTTVQSSMLTGLWPADHGIVGNGWYFRELDEVGFWKQSNELVLGEKIWEALKRTNPNLITSNLFWWYNMNTTVDYSLTPKPHYGADGRKEFDIYSSPSFHREIEKKIGKFPFFSFWGPRAGIEASQWIARCAVEEFKMHRPNLQLVYLPHLDYNLQKLGPNHPQIAGDLAKIDAVVGELVQELDRLGCDSMIVSEYGISPVRQSVSINQHLRRAGWLSVRESLGTEILDTGSSRAFAVADHQVAHVYLKNPEDGHRVKEELLRLPGVETVLAAGDLPAAGLGYAAAEGKRSSRSKRNPGTGKANEGVLPGPGYLSVPDLKGGQESQYSGLAISSHRAGDLVAVASEDSWFNYYYWLDDDLAPDFARTVDIHRKPGYDPVEMFTDPDKNLLPLRVAGKLARKKLGFRMLMDIIPLRPDLVRGSHGRLNTPGQGPLLIGARDHVPGRTESVRHIFQTILNYFAGSNRG